MTRAVRRPRAAESSVTLDAKRRCVTLRRALEPWEAVALSWRRTRALPGLQLWESLTFSFRSGRAYLRLEGESVSETFDLSGGLPEGDPLLGAIARQARLRRRLHAAFCALWGAPLPFGADELNARRLVLLCAFVGYDRDFYDAIPLTLGRLRTPPEFRRTAAALHTAAALLRLVAESGLPQCKSVRRALFVRPALLFYAPELRLLHGVFQDTNRFCALLDEANVFRLLSSLRSYPGTAVFYQDFRRVMGEAALYRLMRDNALNLLLSALRYAASGGSARRREQRVWQSAPYRLLRATCRAYYHESELSYSLPAPPEEKAPGAPAHCVVDGYCFERLGSISDFREAGEQLHNCLSDFTFFDFSGTVYGVQKNGRYLAAVELRDRWVLQAFAARNRPIDSRPALARAFQSWCSRWALTPYEGDIPF